MENALANAGSSAPFEWSEFFDFSLDDQLFLSLEDDDSILQRREPSLPLPPEDPLPPQPPPNPQQIIEQFGVGPAASKRVGVSSDRVRKRDPRMVCSNFLAGRVPCACPEMDQKLAKAAEEAEEEQGAPGKKKVRAGRGGKARCQVPGCEVDITELKGYHRRHRVCLACANASSVSIAGESKRYCQQCGKFHVLASFDEGKRSCRRKLERHNNRRRRKSNDPEIVADPRIAVDEETQGDMGSKDGSSDGEAGKSIDFSGSQNTETELSQDPKDGNIPNFHSGSQYIQSDSGVTFTTSGEIQADEGKDDVKYALSPSYCDNKSAYSSMCPTGRISFKLYDWNPAEFPRRLRLQIFQWLASMPVELEGYIRPGCTIMTAFISMPHFMWNKLFEDPTAYLYDLVAPGKVLSGRGTALVYLNNTIFRVLRDGNFVTKAERDVRAPKLHYINPICFEAGKPMEFIACGSNILQPKFRAHVSFSGKYLNHDYDVAFPHDTVEGEAAASFDYQLCRIHVPQTEPNFSGPAFVEIENECGLSNFIPIIIGNKRVCSEIKTLQHKHNNNSSEAALSDFILDVAWLIKRPASEKMQLTKSSTQIRRFCCLLDFLVRNECIHILQITLESLKGWVDDMESNDTPCGVSFADQSIFLEYVETARNFLCRKGVSQDLLSREGAESIVPIQDMNTRPSESSRISECSTSIQKDETIPLLIKNKKFKTDIIGTKPWVRNSCSDVKLLKTVTKTRPLIIMVAAFAVCFGICTVLLHPDQVGRITVHIRRCLLDSS